MTITAESVRDYCLEAGGWVTRSMIATAHRKGKTTHVINTIKNAVDQGKIVEVDGFDALSRPCKVYRAVLADEV